MKPSEAFQMEVFVEMNILLGKDLNLLWTRRIDEEVPQAAHTR